MLGHRVKAVLGPTNTGKTHLAIERLLAHSSGIIGFPLRLLARENYDRMVARKGPRNVALITGEEKIVPAGARWFSCTVEAMPLDRQAEFVAVDEIQLCADPDRGHVFTDRLLHARGMVETMFLGAETIRPLLQRLVPGAIVETRPRLSQITHAGPAKLTRLPPRTAVVAFSAAEVYAIAELIRRRRGGCAVVMGRLSPRTRNAQVALYQEKEVDFLVATDAIGMGLNMDVDHVAFARLSKFDGHRPRMLLAAEVGQIAGRAGRGMRDGSFGTTADCPPLDDDLVRAVEAHSFEPLEQICWRNSVLDFSGIDALLASLTAPPPGPGLVRGNDATDLETLAALAREPEIHSLARGRTRLRMLWEACQIPDFRKIADDSHIRLCARVFGHIAGDGRLPADWLAGQIAALARADGDIDTLMQRLAGVRVWTYIAARSDWVPDAEHWQARAREVEDLLSDALHERLTTRFVDRRAAHLMRRLEAGVADDLLSAVTRRGEVVVEGHPVGQIEGFGFAPDPLAEGEERKLVLRAARKALREEMPRRVAMLEAAEDAALALLANQRIAWEGADIARLRAGPSALRPQVEVRDSEFLDGPQRERVRLRLQRFIDDQIREALNPLLAAAAAADGDAALRGPLHRLVEGLGVVAQTPEDDVPAALRRRLKVLGVRAGRHALFMPAMLKPRAGGLRAALWALRRGVSLPALPAPGLVAMAAPAEWPDGFAQAMGWVDAGPVLRRLDVAERVAGELAWASRVRPIAVPVGLASRLSVKAEMLPAVLRRLGFRLFPAATLAEGQFGPPAPAMMALARRRRPEPSRGGDPTPARTRPARHEPAREGPFAALAALRH
ncbi:helicase-related protein [Limobrevibacterium gyesilva]|uniref:Helicase-related protein n=1 Tax=Limobrevibacterium gyesilva TaxID=2991712 RepID=A0AA41YIZ8_9PROT|nr:helicase-related protein [Limobrevibacterium gyesilva]MCW3473400.1 helicase-related protein [Limobrevibacterium gyesilva]